MLTIESGLIGKNGIIECKYYELEEKCIEIVELYCMESTINRQKFEQFAENYNLFRPYFDFVVGVLGYKVINAEMEKDTILVGKNNHMYKYKKDEDINTEKAFCYVFCDDKTLNIYPMTLDSSTYHDCLINGEGKHMLPSDMYGHVHLFQQILNMILISNKDICEDYLNYTSDLGMFVQRYYPLLRFQADKQGNMVVTRSFYRKDNITKIQENFLSDLLDNRYTYPFYLYNVGEVDEYSNTRDISTSLKYLKDNNQTKII